MQGQGELTFAMLAETNKIIYLSDIAVLQTHVICQTRIQKIRRDKFHVSKCNHESKADTGWAH